QSNSTPQIRLLRKVSRRCSRHNCYSLSHPLPSSAWTADDRRLVGHAVGLLDVSTADYLFDGTKPFRPVQTGRPRYRGRCWTICVGIVIPHARVLRPLLLQILLIPTGRVRNESRPNTATCVKCVAEGIHAGDLLPRLSVAGAGGFEVSAEIGHRPVTLRAVEGRRLILRAEFIESHSQCSLAAGQEFPNRHSRKLAIGIPLPAVANRQPVLDRRLLECLTAIEAGVVDLVGAADGVAAHWWSPVTRSSPVAGRWRPDRRLTRRSRRSSLRRGR